MTTKSFAGSGSSGQGNLRVNKVMKKHWTNIFSLIAFLSVILTAFFTSCKTTKPAVDTKDLSYLYNPTRNTFNPGYFVSLESDESATVTVRFLSNELFFSEANPEGVPTAGIIISARLFRVDEGRLLTDTVSYNINIIKEGNKREYLYNVPLKVESGNKYLVEMKVLDRLRMIVSQSFVPFNTLYPFNK